ncbi:broad specificity phosphatase PhoE [Allocatelliglobosispora scoriae]|uniref:Broad specificity phosphatase PhoE n=1 Tax=Allocatelliglobosispora scoriae TaxID=643052 RepID=A0A841BV54_9ACTN|nr:histidine phosphatase family protein [Allocatelliglobosispora scoriae]MBB5870793.1 broad specificity phosphatase PhoE [Allocatelliglobosispora scoriae]
MKTVVHVLRHGEVFNPTKILYGRLPGYHLSELGIKMAEVVADSLTGHDITHVVSSPLERAVQTAGPTAEKFGLEIAIDDRLIESENWFQGKRVAVGDGALRSPGSWPKLWNPFRPSWGEPYKQVAERMTGALHTARDNARGHEALVVSHQLPIWELRLYQEGKRLWHDPRKRQCGLASLTSFVFDGDKLVGIDYSEPTAGLGPGVGVGA